MKVIKITPRGYCHGVVTAMNKVAEVLANDEIEKPVYIIGQIVHNKNITDSFLKSGAITLYGKTRKEILNQVNSGTIIITAHGIDYKLIIEAKSKGINVIDATCSDVYKTHDLIEEKIKDGYHIIYIGKKGHPEPEGVLGISKENITLIENKKDIELLDIANEKICITNQTTMSIWDVDKLMKDVTIKYPKVEKIKEICLATQQRQEAVFKMAKGADLTIVVGDIESHNSKKLLEVSEKKAKTKAVQINSIFDLDYNILLNENIEKVAITSGASTPTILTKQVIDFVENFDKKNKKTWEMPEPIEFNRIIPRIRNKV